MGSDHQLVMTTLKLKLKKIRSPQSLRVKYVISRLSNAETLENFRIKIGGKFAPLLEMTEMQEMTDLFADGMNEAALEVLGKEKKRKQPWMTKEIMEKYDERRRLKADTFKDDECNKKHRAANNLVMREIKKAREEFVQKKC